MSLPKLPYPAVPTVRTGKIPQSAVSVSAFAQPGALSAFTGIDR